MRRSKYNASNLEHFLSTTCSQQFRAFILDLEVSQPSMERLMKKFEVHDSDPARTSTTSIIILDESSSNSKVTQTASGLQGEKEFFKLLVLAELMNLPISDPEVRDKFIRKINPADMFYKAKMTEKLKINEFPEWIRRQMQLKLSQVPGQASEECQQYRDIMVRTCKDVEDQDGP